MPRLAGEAWARSLLLAVSKLQCCKSCSSWPMGHMQVLLFIAHASCLVAMQSTTSYPGVCMHILHAPSQCTLGLCTLVHMCAEDEITEQSLSNALCCAVLGAYTRPRTYSHAGAQGTMLWLHAAPFCQPRLLPTPSLRLLLVAASLGVSSCSRGDALDATSVP